VLEGITDIDRQHEANLPDYKLTAEDREQEFSQLVARAHEHGVKVFGATISPYRGAGYFTANGEKIRQTINHWILTSGGFDGTIDFDKTTGDAANPLTFAPPRVHLVISVLKRWLLGTRLCRWGRSDRSCAETSAIPDGDASAGIGHRPRQWRHFAQQTRWLCRCAWS